MTRAPSWSSLLAVCGCTLAGCDLSMTRAAQATRPTRRPRLWPDGTSARPLPDDVVAQGDVERASDRQNSSPPVTAGAAGARPRALRHFLRAVPRPRRRWRRHHRRARLSGAAVLSHRPARRRAGAAFLRRHHRRLRRDVLLCRSRRAARSLGDRRLYPRAATVAPRHRRPSARCQGQAAMSLRDHPAGDRRLLPCRGSLRGRR